MKAIKPQLTISTETEQKHGFADSKLIKLEFRCQIDRELLYEMNKDGLEQLQELLLETISNFKAGTRADQKSGA